MAKKFFYVCAGILMLVGAYSLEAQKVEAQLPSQEFAGITFSMDGGGNVSTTAITASGDIFAIADYPKGDYSTGAVVWINTELHGTRDWVYMGNVLTGPVKAGDDTIDGVKSMFR